MLLDNLRNVYAIKLSNSNTLIINHDIYYLEFSKSKKSVFIKRKSDDLIIKRFNTMKTVFYDKQFFNEMMGGN